jgi:hypothetical protein
MDLAPEWLRKSWETANQTGLGKMTSNEIDAEIAAAPQDRARQRR